ncbi:MAG: sulfatase-like hydrolase/transferase, partial [Verrucomicrobiae bacterium]|nr:sulfatase-like hydrolase/transferase [Verrucomicrobiae bacterium]
DDVPPLGRAFSSTDTMETILEKGQHKEAFQGYLASTTFADAQIGRVLDALGKSAYGDNTLVVLWSDHGFHLGEKLHWQKGTLWEEATHNLLIFRVPGLTQAGGVSTQLVSLLDLYPTLVDLCGLPDPGHLDGESLVPLLKEPSARLRTHVITAYDGQIAVRTDQYRYIRYSDGNDELYANSEDPHEWVNLSRNADFARVKTKLNALLPLPEEMPESLSLKKQN